jgi:hypothetical protein
MIKQGSWWIESKSDPRWNCQGQGYVGGFECPSDATSAMEEKKKELGEDPPDDLKYGYMKD